MYSIQIIHCSDAKATFGAWSREKFCMAHKSWGSWYDFAQDDNAYMALLKKGRIVAHGVVGINKF